MQIIDCSPPARKQIFHILYVFNFIVCANLLFYYSITETFFMFFIFFVFFNLCCTLSLGFNDALLHVNFNWTYERHCPAQTAWQTDCIMQKLLKTKKHHANINQSQHGTPTQPSISIFPIQNDVDNINGVSHHYVAAPKLQKPSKNKLQYILLCLFLCLLTLFLLCHVFHVLYTITMISWFFWWIF